MIIRRVKYCRALTSERALAMALFVAVVIVLSTTATAWGVGELTQPADKTGCVSASVALTSCERVVGLDGIRRMVPSPDGKNLYAASSAASAISILDRNPTTGTLGQRPTVAACIADHGSGRDGGCADGVALDGAISVAISPDGRNVYAVSANSDAVNVFDRDPLTGTLRQKDGTDGCVSETGTGGECEDGTALESPFDVAVSPDGTNVYVTASESDAVNVFDRDPLTGTLRQKDGTDGCVSETGTGGECEDGTALESPFAVAVSQDGKSLYVASQGSDAIDVFDRNRTTGTLRQKANTDGCISETGTGGECEDGTALDGVFDLVASQDGKNVYVASAFSNALDVFDRNRTTGTLRQKANTSGCISETGTGNACQDGAALLEPRDVAITADGESVYTTSRRSEALNVFDRDLDTGALEQKLGRTGCVSQVISGCQDGRALGFPSGVSVSPDGENVYVAATLSFGIAILNRSLIPTEIPPVEAPPIQPQPRVAPPPPPTETLALAVSDFRFTPPRFRVTHKLGSNVHFTLSTAADVQLLIERVRFGRLVGGQCRPMSPESIGHARCKRLTRKGVLSYARRNSGTNFILFSGKVARRALVPGRYRATITASDASGNKSTPRQAGFMVLRRIPRRR